MKLIISVLLISFSFLSFAQEDYSEFQNEINKKAKMMEDILMAKDYISDFEKMNVVGFTIDTFKIERMLSIRLSEGFTNADIISALQDAEKKYDALLNKYYQILLNRLHEGDRKALIESQKNRIKYRDSEKLLNLIISMPQYSGGGTMYRLTVADENFEISKKRVIELYNHISRFFEYEY